MKKSILAITILALTIPAVPALAGSTDEGERFSMLVTIGRIATGRGDNRQCQWLLADPITYCQYIQYGCFDGGGMVLRSGSNGKPICSKEAYDYMIKHRK